MGRGNIKVQIERQTPPKYALTAAEMGIALPHLTRPRPSSGFVDGGQNEYSTPIRLASTLRRMSIDESIPHQVIQTVIHVTYDSLRSPQGLSGRDLFAYLIAIAQSFRFLLKTPLFTLEI